MTRRPLATAAQMAEHYGVSIRTIYCWHQEQVSIGPCMFKIGKHLRARWDDIDKYDAQRAAESEAA